MTDIMDLMLIIPLCLVAGYVFAKVKGGIGKKGSKIKETEKEPEEFRAQFEKEKNPEEIVLRNGYGITRDENPTFAEQWVNIMNYSGENQKEEGYGEN